MAKPQQTSTDVLVEEVRVYPGVTAATLAATVGIGGSTAAKRLAALEKAGTLRRTRGGREPGGRRLPDTWTTIGPTTAETVPARTGSGKPVPTATNRDALGESGVRLGRGGLGVLVLDYLTARPGETFGPAQIGKALGRSAEAVANSLTSMAAAGQVQLAADKPRRYQAVTVD